MAVAVAGVGAGARAEIMDKVGAKNKYFRLRNTASPFHTVLPIPPPTSLPSCSPPLPFSSTNPGGKERQKKFNFYFHRKKKKREKLRQGKNHTPQNSQRSGSV